MSKKNRPTEEQVKQLLTEITKKLEKSGLQLEEKKLETNSSRDFLDKNLETLRRAFEINPNPILATINIGEEEDNEIEIKLDDIDIESDADINKFRSLLQNYILFQHSSAFSPKDSFSQLAEQRWHLTLKDDSVLVKFAEKLLNCIKISTKSTKSIAFTELSDLDTQLSLHQDLLLISNKQLQLKLNTLKAEHEKIKSCLAEFEDHENNLPVNAALSTLNHYNKIINNQISDLEKLIKIQNDLLSYLQTLAPSHTYNLVQFKDRLNLIINSKNNEYPDLGLIKIKTFNQHDFEDSDNLLHSDSILDKSTLGEDEPAHQEDNTTPSDTPLTQSSETFENKLSSNLSQEPPLSNSTTISNQPPTKEKEIAFHNSLTRATTAAQREIKNDRFYFIPAEKNKAARENYLQNLLPFIYMADSVTNLENALWFIEKLNCMHHINVKNKLGSENRKKRDVTLSTTIGIQKPSEFTSTIMFLIQNLCKAKIACLSEKQGSISDEKLQTMTEADENLKQHLKEHYKKTFHVISRYRNRDPLVVQNRSVIFNLKCNLLNKYVREAFEKDSKQSSKQKRVTILTHLFPLLIMANNPDEANKALEHIENYTVFTSKKTPKTFLSPPLSSSLKPSTIFDLISQFVAAKCNFYNETGSVNDVQQAFSALLQHLGNSYSTVYFMHQEIIIYYLELIKRTQSNTSKIDTESLKDWLIVTPQKTNQDKTLLNFVV